MYFHGCLACTRYSLLLMIVSEHRSQLWKINAHLSLMCALCTFERRILLKLPNCRDPALKDQSHWWLSMRGVGNF